MLSDHTMVARKKNREKFSINYLQDFVNVRFSFYLVFLFFLAKKKKKTKANYSISQKVETD